MLPLEARRRATLKQADEKRRTDCRKRSASAREQKTKVHSQTDTAEDTSRHLVVRVKPSEPKPSLALRKRNEESKKAPLRTLPLATRHCRGRSTSVLTKKDLPDVVPDTTRSRASLSRRFTLSPVPITPTKPLVLRDPDCGKNDPQLCREYIKDIYRYFLKTERKEIYVIKKDFLVSFFFVRPTHRTILIDWLFQLQPKFGLLNETMYLCVDILDRVLQVEPRVPKNKLQLIGVTALFIASKYEEIYPPALSELVYATAHTYTTHQILAKEIEVHKKLHYEYNKPYCIAFLRRYSIVMDTTTNTHNLAKYMLELSLLDYRCSSLLPSKRAAAALLLSAHIMMPQKPPSKIWDDHMSYHTKYRVREIQDAKLKLKRAVQEGHSSPRTTAIRKKYRDSVLSNSTTSRALDRL